MGNAFFTYFLFLTFGGALGRVVRVPAGPLLRVEGQEVRIRCSVSDYEGPREQDFEWMVLRNGEQLQLVSTFDLSYTDRSLQARVDRGDIAVERLSGDTMDLRIRNLQPADSATYRCSTPSTDSVIRGNYNAEVRLKVIKDSLQVAPIAPAPPAAVPEGAPIDLRCTASADPAHNTHLSVTWAVRNGSASRPILTFGPEHGVTPETSSRQRYADGGLRLDLPGGGVYSLRLMEAEPADGGVYMCSAKQWVREQGGAWQEILQRSADVGEVEVTPTSRSLAVAVEGDRTLGVGDALQLSCSITADDLTVLGLEVSWLVASEVGGGPTDQRVLAHLTRDGVLSDPSDRVAVSRVGAGEFRLRVDGVGPADSGQYSCTVAAWVRRAGGNWYWAAEKNSTSATVLVTVLEPEFKVSLRVVETPQVAGDAAQLECQVSDVQRLQDGRLGVAWHYTETTPADAPASTRLIAALDAQGNLQLGEQYRQRLQGGDLVLFRAPPDTFTLRLLRTLDSDRGQYSCTASAWTAQPDHSWTKSREEQSGTVSLSWTHMPPELAVTARPLREATAGGATFEMSCQVAAEHLQRPGYSVLVRVEETVGGKARKILSLSPDSVLKLEEWDELGRTDSVVLEKTGASEFRFRLYGAQVSDRGFYSCEVTAWTPAAGNTWTKALSAVSNTVQISFADTGPAFNVSIQPAVTSVLPGQTATIECILTAVGVSPKAGDLSYEVRWYRRGLRALDRPALLVSVDRLGVVREGGQNQSSDCSLQQTDASTFALRIHGARDADGGEFHCAATPWLRSRLGAWASGQELTSPTALLAISFTLWDSLQLPLLLGVGAALAVGLLSVLLGFTCTRFCCRNAKHTPRSRNGLMDLEMD